MYEDILDEAEDLRTDLPAPEVAQILERRGRELEPGAAGRAAYLYHAAEQWRIENEQDRVRACLEEAVRDGGSATVDPRAGLVDALLVDGETARADELMTELRRDIPRGRARGEVHLFVGEALEEHGRLKEALRWFTAGVTRAELDGDIDGMSLLGRFRVRRELELPHDTYDDMAESYRENYLDAMAASLEDDAG